MFSQKIRIVSLVSITAFAALLLSACMPDSRAGNVYSRDQARTAQTVEYGTIQRVEPVTLEGTDSGMGTLAGGAMGGVLGNSVGGGSGKAIATVGGAIVGGLAGTAIERQATTRAAVEIEVRLDSGEILVIVQEQDADYRVGDRVRVVSDSRGTSRVRY
jgi:outer membrane lipoprotein SlyB